MRKKIQKKGFSIILALGLMMLLSFAGIYVLEYMVPFSRSIKGVENASKAYYESYSGLEDAIYRIDPKNIQNIPDSDDFPNNYVFDLISENNFIPRQGEGEGTSEYDSNRNKLSQVFPVRIMLPSGRTISSIRLAVGVPDFDGDSNRENLILGGYSDLILLQLSSPTSSISSDDPVDLNSGSSHVELSNVFTHIGRVQGDEIGASTEPFSDFYTRECSAVDCVLRVGVIGDLISPEGAELPYLEYLIEASRSIPLPNAHITSLGNSFGYSKELQVRIPYATTNAAFDFAVFQ